MPIQKDPERTEILHLDKMAVFAGRHVLEIGSGDGRLTWRVAPSAGRVTGIDLDADALTVAATGRPAILQETISFARASSLDLPFLHGTFDIAILAWSF